MAKKLFGFALAVLFVSIPGRAAEEAGESCPRAVARTADGRFGGDILPTRIPLLRLNPFAARRPSLPFPHPWNYTEPLDILSTYFWNADQETGSGRDNRYSVIPFVGPVLVTRDAGLIKAILTATGDKPGQFDRDQLPSTGIARSTGPDTMLFANGSQWRRHRSAAAAPFGLTALFQQDVFEEFQKTFVNNMKDRVGRLRRHLAATGQTEFRMQLEPEIKAIMLEMLANNFFGAQIPSDLIRSRYVPAIERIIDRIVRDTVVSRLKMGFGSGRPGTKADNAIYDELTDLVLEARHQGRGMWPKLKTDATDDQIRANVKVILAGALEATASYGGWTLTHLAHAPQYQQRIFEEVKDIRDYTPDALENAEFLRAAMEETLRLTPSLYFLPRKATADTTITTDDGRTMLIPKGTHILLDIWDHNRNERRFGVEQTGYSALEYHPERWLEMKARGVNPKDMLHFGFGFGSRVCPGKHLGQLEVSLLIAAMVKTFEFEAVNPKDARAGVSTKPRDGTEVILRLRNAETPAEYR